MDDLLKSRIIQWLQAGIPLESEPFKALSGELSMDAATLLSVIQGLKNEKIIRQISPIYDTRLLGYDSALVAFKVNDGNLETAAEAINAYPGVSHNYERKNNFNLWFTLAVPPDSKFGLGKIVDLLAEETGTHEHITLRSMRVFKIGVKLDPASMGLEREESTVINHTFIPLSGKEKQIVLITQADMPLVQKPFGVYAEILGIEEPVLIDKLKEFQERGIMRRFAAVLHHRKIGFSANGMAVWEVPEERVEEIGNKIASYKAVSHCYERKSSSRKVWRYNLFSMIHGKSQDEVEKIVREIRKETGLEEFSILYSVREFKKKRVSYFTDELYHWENRHLSSYPVNA